MTAYDCYWEFAAERQKIFWNRYHKQPYTTNDGALRQHKFTNCYRVLDRVTQYLISHVQKEAKNEEDAIFRTLLFKQFNRIGTWEQLEQRMGYISFHTQLQDVGNTLSIMKAEGLQIYSGAYMINTPRDGTAKHWMSLKCVYDFVHHPNAWEWTCLEDIYKDLRSIKNHGNFLAYQYAIDINYIIGYPESTFVVPGPGCIEGVMKCHGPSADPLWSIWRTAERQVEEFAKRGLEFKWIPNRALQWIDIQNLYCEIGKYLRWKMPHLNTGRSRIKAKYSKTSEDIEYSFPEAWRVDMSMF